jgi:hypothetical protein
MLDGTTRLIGIDSYMSQANTIWVWALRKELAIYQRRKKIPRQISLDIKALLL